MKKLQKKQHGFTLVELLAVMMAFAIVGSVAGGILITSLRTSNKASVITSVKQNGDFVVTQMSKVLRDARELVNPYPCNILPTPPTVAQTVQVITNEGDSITVGCFGLTPTPGTTPAPTITVIGSLPTIASASGTSNATSLLDSSAVRVSSCTITCSQAYKTDYPVITILFSLIQKSTTAFGDQIASATAVNFSTSVTLRNIIR